MAPVLSYDKKLRRFYLRPWGNSRLVARLEADQNWRLYKSGIYETDLIPAAARFRKYADEAARKFFKRAFVKTYPAPTRRLPKILDPHQVDGVTWALTRSRSYLAHAPGAGKTLEAIVISLYAEGAGQTVFIVPPTLTVNWESEIYRFLEILRPDVWPSVTVVPETASAEFTGWQADYIIVPDSMLTKPWVLKRLIEMKKKIVAVDEASRFKEPTAARSIALFGGTHKSFKSPGLVKSARHAVLLDGSPMPNRPMELWAPVYAMMPEAIDFMSQRQFGFRYCGAVMNERGNYEFKHSSNEAELKAKLQQKFMHVVPESALSHPERLRSIVFLSEDTRTKEVKAWDRRMLATVDPADVSEDESQGDMATMRREYGLSVMKPASRYIRERLETGEPILVFAWHRDVVTGLFEMFCKDKPGLVMGGTSKADREDSIARFQRGKTNLVFLNISAGGRGYNLQRADRVIFVEPSWTDENNKQCEKRASRKGRDSSRPVKSDYLAVRGSFVERVLHSAFTKERRVRRIIG